MEMVRQDTAEEIKINNEWQTMRDAHDELKAIGAELNVPTQVVNDRTFGFGYDASIAWRLAIALYVKAGGTPWRLAGRGKSGRVGA